MKRPYILRNYDHMAYHVIDRKTGEKVGYVLAGYTGWYAYLSSNPGVEVAHPRYRGEAAEAVWQASR